MISIFVTGSSGFIGRRLVRALGEEGLPWTPLSRGNNNGDWIKPRILADSVCIHLAGISDLGSTLGDPDRVVREARSLALGLVEMNFSHIVFASSAAIYGDKSTRPHTESDPEVLDHPYARAKSEAENILRKESDTVVRLANVYGPGMAKNNIFSDILNQLSQDTEALFVRDGSSIRDFVHVDDVVDGFIRIAKAPQSGVFNLGSGVGTKAEDLGRLVLDVAGQKNRKVASLKLGDSGSCLVLDSSKMMKTYTWRPRKSLEEGIGEMLAAYQLRKQ